MLSNTVVQRLLIVILSCLCLCSCFYPPYNHFREDHRNLRRIAFGTGFGAGVGAIAGAAAGNVGVGALIGGVTGSMIGYYYTTKPQLIKELAQQDIEYVQHGDTLTLIVPTDRYFMFNSARLNDICYPGLLNIVRLLKFYPYTPIYVAAFTDNVGARSHNKKLSQAKAEAMLTFLWANGIQAQRLHAQGYGEKHAIGNNRIIHGSAYNRRLEIQWLNVHEPKPKRLAFIHNTK